MAVRIGTDIAGTITQATGLSNQQHLIYAENAGRWVLFYVASTSTTTLKSYVSSGADLSSATWSAGASLTLPTNQTWFSTEGRDLAVYYKNIANTDVIHLAMITTSTVGDSKRFNHCRATLSGSTITYGTINEYNSEVASDYPGGVGVVVSPDNFIIVMDNVAGNPEAVQSSNADAGTSWTAGFSLLIGLTAVTNQANSFCAVPYSTNSVIIGSENGALTEPDSMSNVNTFRREDTSWNLTSIDILATDLGTGVSSNQWAMVGVSANDVHAVVASGTNTFTHRRWNGTSWGAGATITAQAFKAGAGLHLATDGTSVWLFIIDSDSANTVRYAKFSGSTWGSWTALESTTATRNFISGYKQVSNNQVGVIYTQTDGTNFDVYVTRVAVSSRLPLSLNVNQSVKRSNFF